MYYMSIYTLHMENNAFRCNIDCRTFFPCTKAQFNKLLKIADYCNADRGEITEMIYRYCTDHLVTDIEHLITVYKFEYKYYCDPKYYNRVLQKKAQERVRQLERNKKKVEKFTVLLEGMRNGS